MGRLLLCLGLLAVLSACGSGRPVASVITIEHDRYTDPSPPSLTLVTSIRTAAGSGAHSAIIINASQRVIFDPAGSFEATSEGKVAGPQRGDVIYGVSPEVLAAYLKFQSSTGYHVVTLSIPVPAAVAEEALVKAEDHGWVSQAFCADASSQMLASLPGFEKVHVTLFPRALMRQVEKLPGVTMRTLVDGREVPNGSAWQLSGGKGSTPLSDF